MSKEIARVQDDVNWRKSLMNLPTELLVKILCYLPTRDKITIRYVSQWFKKVGETASLWREFVWPDYEPRHVRSVAAALNVCGKHVRRIHFPAHVTPTQILGMAYCCTNVTHLILPEQTQLNLDHLEEIVRTMTSLQQLDVFTSDNFIQIDFDQYGELLPKFYYYKYIERLLSITAANVKQLKLQTDIHPGLALISIQEWANHRNPLPSSINILAEDNLMAAARLFKFWSASRYKLPSFEIGLYDIKRVPMNLYPPVPLRKFQFGPAATLPFIKLSDQGMLDLKYDTFYFTDYDHYGEIRHSITPKYPGLYAVKEEHFNGIGNLHSVTNADFSYVDINPSHLERLAVVCPNLQRLNLKGNRNCLNDLQGLHAIVHTCENLEGLNLTGISVSLVESHLLLWELLLSLKKLTHLAINLCVLKPYDISTLNNCDSLQALEIHADGNDDHCMVCNDDTYLLFSHFPSLVHCRMYGFRYPGIKCALTNCCKLKYFYEDCPYAIDDLPQLSNKCNIQQLCIKSNFDLTDEFVDLLTAHGQLECVVLFVRSITISGITNLINNSPNLTLLHISIKLPLFDDNVGLFWSTNTDYTDRVKKIFSYRKLFATGSFKVCLNDRFHCCHACKKGTTLLHSDLNSLWSTIDTNKHL